MEPVASLVGQVLQAIAVLLNHLVRHRLPVHRHRHAAAEAAVVEAVETDETS